MGPFPEKMALAEVNLSPNVISTCHAFLSRIVKGSLSACIYVTDSSWGVLIFSVFLRVVPPFLPSVTFATAQKSRMADEGIRPKRPTTKEFTTDRHQLALRLT